MIRKILAAHRNLFLAKKKLLEKEKVVMTINQEYGFIHIVMPEGHIIYPTLVDIYKELGWLSQTNNCPVTFPPIIKQSLLYLFKAPILEKDNQISQTAFGLYLGVAPSWVSRELKLQNGMNSTNTDIELDNLYLKCLKGEWKDYFENKFLNATEYLKIDDDILYIKIPTSVEKIRRKGKVAFNLNLNKIHDKHKSKKLNDSEPELMSVLKDIRASQQIIISMLLEMNRKLK